jgi:nickel-dependent lactate racemase
MEAEAPPGLSWLTAEPEGTATSAAAPPMEPPARPALDRLLDEPLTGPSFGEFLRGVRRLAVVVPDRTRPAALDVLLPVVFERVRSHTPAIAIDLLIGGGTHAPEDPSRVLGLLPPALRRGANAHSHDAHDPGMRSRGTTAAGTPIVVSERVFAGDACIVLGGIGYHYFAGFSGGRKGLFPGLGGYEAIRRNHELILHPQPGEGLHPGCRPGNLAGNPIHLDVLDVVRAIDVPVFALHAAISPGGGPEEILSGDLFVAHAEACRRYGDRHRQALPARGDLVLADAGGHPRDIDLIQVHKALVHLAPAVRDGGVVVLAARCSEGVGSKTFLPWFLHGSSREMERALRAAYTLNAHTALSFRKLTERFRLHLVSELDERIVSSLGAFPFRSLESALTAGVDRLRAGGSGVATHVLRSPLATRYEIADREGGADRVPA